MERRGRGKRLGSKSVTGGMIRSRSGVQGKVKGLFILGAAWGQDTGSMSKGTYSNRSQVYTN